MGPLTLELPVTADQRILAAALAGDEEALVRCSSAPIQMEIERFHRLSPALALRAQRQGISGPAIDRWREVLVRVAARSLLFQQRLEDAGRSLADAGIQWIALKGMDLASRVYDQPEERPTTDIDVLVAAESYGPARAALESSGWESAFSGAPYDAWIVEEGHAWTAIQRSDRVALELHIRLWGMLASQAAGDLVKASVPDPNLAAGGHRPPLAYAFIVAAVHGLLDAPPRPLFYWWDLERIIAAGPPEIAEQICGLARRWEVELLVVLAAAQVSALWSNPACAWISDELVADLKPVERRVALRANRLGLDAAGASLSIARLLSGRRTRSGWTPVLRHFWAHPGVIIQETPSDWPQRPSRMYHLLNATGFERCARWLFRRRLEQASHDRPVR